MLPDKEQVIEILKNTMQLNVEFGNISLVHFDTRKISTSMNRKKVIYFGHMSVNLPLELYQNPYQQVSGQPSQIHGMYAALDLRISRCITTSKSDYMNWRIFNDEIKFLLFDELWYLPNNFEHITNYGIRNGNQLLPENGVYTDANNISAYRLDKAYSAAFGTSPFVEPVINFTGYRIQRP